VRTVEKEGEPSGATLAERAIPSILVNGKKWEVEEASVYIPKKEDLKRRTTWTPEHAAMELMANIQAITDRQHFPVLYIPPGGERREVYMEYIYVAQRQGVQMINFGVSTTVPVVDENGVPMKTKRGTTRTRSVKWEAYLIMARRFCGDAAVWLQEQAVAWKPKPWTQRKRSEPQPVMAVKEESPVKEAFLNVNVDSADEE